MLDVDFELYIRPNLFIKADYDFTGPPEPALSAVIGPDASQGISF
jgi:hypothetical protein